MMEMDAIKLEGREFIIIDEIIKNNIKYIYLSKSDDYEHFCIRKINIKDGKEMLVGLDNDEEFDLAYKEFVNKHLED